MRAEWDNQDTDFELLLEKYEELVRNAKILAFRSNCNALALFLEMLKRFFF